MIRYRSGDVTTLYTKPCACGRSLARMENIAYRSDDTLGVEGVAFLPSEIGHVLSRIEHVTSQFCLVIKREETTDRIELKVEVTPDIFHDSVKPLESLRVKIEQELYERLRIRPTIKLVEPESLEGEEHVQDLRNDNQE